MSDANDFVIENGVLTNYVGPAGDVIIPDGVTSIGNHAFFWRRNLTKSVTIPESVTEIDNCAFEYCGLENVKIPSSVTSIGNRAFAECRNLKGVKIPDSVTDIGVSAFHGCTSLADQDGFLIIRGVLYDYKGAEKHVKIPDSVTDIGEYAFMDCISLESTEIPESVKSIGRYAFNECSSLKNVTIPDSVNSIGESAFHKKTHILIRDLSVLPASLRINAVIGFLESGGGKDHPGFASHSKYIKTNAAKLVKMAMEEPGFLSMMCREKLITPKNMDLYLEAAQKNGSTEMISMMMDYQVNMISPAQKKRVEKSKEKEQDTIAERMTARQEKVGIDGLNIAVTGKLETFENREELKRFIIEKGGKPASSLSAKVDYLIMNDPESDSTKTQKARDLGIEIITERRFNELAGRAFVMEGSILVKYNGTGGDVVIPENVSVIGDSAFGYCNVLTGVTIPIGVTDIGKSAFFCCEGMRGATITIPESVTSIGGWAFFRNGLADISIPASVTNIGEKAFDGCPKLTIHAPAGSCAEQYAKENNIRVIAE